MKVVIFILLLLLSFPSFGQSKTILDVVFDLDWTILYPLESTEGINPKHIVIAEGRPYRVADETAKVLFNLSLRSDLRISFYSGGSELRNTEALKGIMLPDGRSAYDIAYKVLHFDDLVEVSTDAALPFTERFKKDLSLVNSDFKTVILIDDSRNFTMPNQSKHQLWLGKTYNFYERFEDVPKEASKYDPANEFEWKRERGKLISSYFAILEVYEFKERPNAIELLPKALPLPRPCDLDWH